jgi:hypothetical protein
MADMKQFIRDNRVSMTSEWAPSNPNMDGSDKMDNWKCKLRAGRRSMTVYFSKGVGHGGVEPGAGEVLDCLASDASGVVNARGFEDWCDDYGYDHDSRKAERTFRTIERQAASLRRLLGEEAYEALLWNTERE